MKERERGREGEAYKVSSVYNAGGNIPGAA